MLVVAAPARQIQQPQHSPEEKPDPGASIGLVLDNSKSMAAKRDAMVAAMHLLVQATNPGDEFFVVNFNEHPYLDQEFTEDRSLIGAAVDKAGARGGTALYDALSAAVDHLNKAARHEKHMLVLVSDGGDNESNIPSKQLLDAMRGPIHEPVIYSIGLFDPGDDSRAANFLRQLAKQTAEK